MAYKDAPPAIRACIFDMDGLLIDSEDLYTVCTNEVLREYGRPDLPWKIKAQMQGRPGPEAGRIFQEWAQLPITRAEMMAKVSAIQKREFTKTKPLPGTEMLLQNLAHRTEPRIHLALATSSHEGNFRLKTAHLEDRMFKAFTSEHRVLGDDTRIPAGQGKPAPDIYLLALSTINERLTKEGEREVQPSECLVFEDSVPGVESGRRAGMQVVWCPHEGLLQEYRGREQEVLAGLTGEMKEMEEKDNEIGVAAGEEGKERKKGPPGEIGDGWARLVESLEDFPFAEYGIHVKEDGRL